MKLVNLKFIKQLIFSFLSLGITLLLSSQANATLTSRDLVLNSGDGLLTYDDQTNYEWLDVTQTLNMSFNQVLNELSTGGSFAGFSVASTANVQAMILSGGWSGTFNTGYNNDLQKYNELSLIGGMLGSTTATYIGPYGMVSDTLGSEQYYNSIVTLNIPTANYFSYASLNIFQRSNTLPSDYIGTFLYRTAAVPESNTYAMALMGLGLMGFNSRRCKNKQA